MFILEKSKKFGVATIDGKNIVDVKYAQIDISGKYLYVKDKTGKTEVLDSEGKNANMAGNVSKSIVADGKYTIVIKNENNKTLYGIENEQGNVLVETKYSYIEYLFNNLFIASNSEGKLGIIDDKGTEKVEMKYSSIQKVKDTQLLQCSISSEKIIEIYSENLEKLVGMSNVKIAEINDFIKVFNQDEIVYLTKQGKKVTNKEVYQNNKLFAIKKDGKWGFEDENGSIKVECKYDKVTEFNEFGFAGIQQDGKWGVIDSDMKVILEPKYEFEASYEPYFLGSFYKVTYGFGEVVYTNN